MYRLQNNLFMWLMEIANVIKQKQRQIIDLPLFYIKVLILVS